MPTDRKLGPRSARYRRRPYSHVHDALQYALSGGGEVRALTAQRGAPPARPVTAKIDGNVWGRRR